MRLRPIKPKPPGYRAAQLVLVPVIAALLAVGSFVACDNSKESSWNSPRQTPTEAPVFPARRLASEIQTTPTPEAGPTSRSTPTTAPAKLGDAPSIESRPSDQQEQRNFSARPDTLPESIQSDGLTPCQRSAAACFASGGLDTLMDNLDGLSVNRDTGRFCFEFQDGCERR